MFLLILLDAVQQFGSVNKQEECKQHVWTKDITNNLYCKACKKVPADDRD